MISIAGKVEIATRAMEKGIIKTPQEYINFLNDEIDSEKSIEIIVNLFTKETSEE